MAACLICRAPDLEAINDALRTAGVRPTARAWPNYPLKRLFTHRRDCLGLSGPAEGAEPVAVAACATAPPPELTPSSAVPKAKPARAPSAAQLPAPAVPSSPPDAPTGRRYDLLPPHPAALTAVERVQHVASLILGRTWGTAARQQLADAWEVDGRTIRNYAAAAGALLAMDRGSFEVQRALSIAETEEIKRIALDGNEDGPDIKGAISAQVHLDKIRGVLVQAPTVNVNIAAQKEQDDSTAELWARVREKLSPIPGAVEAAAEAIQEFTTERARAMGIIDTVGEAA